MHCEALAQHALPFASWDECAEWLLLPRDNERCFQCVNEPDGDTIVLLRWFNGNNKKRLTGNIPIQKRKTRERNIAKRSTINKMKMLLFIYLFV